MRHRFHHCIDFSMLLGPQRQHMRGIIFSTLGLTNSIRALSLQRGPALAGAGSSQLHAFCEVREMVGTRSASTCSTAPPLALHLLLKLVEEAPVGALGDDLLRGTLDQANLVQAQGIKAHRVFWVIFP